MKTRTYRPVHQVKEAIEKVRNVPISQLSDEYSILLDAIETYIEALQFYADTSNWRKDQLGLHNRVSGNDLEKRDSFMGLISLGGHKARKALGEECSPS